MKLYIIIIYNVHVKIMSKISSGCLASSVGGACNSWSRGFKFQPHIGYKDLLKNKIIPSINQSIKRSHHYYNTLKHFRKPGWLTWLSICLWHRSWSWHPGIKPYIPNLLSGESTSPSPFDPPLCSGSFLFPLSLSFSQMNNFLFFLFFMRHLSSSVG